MYKKFMIVVMVIVSLLSAGCNSGNIVGTVNGEKVTRQQYNQEYKLVKLSYESQQGTKVGEKDTSTVKKLQDEAFNDLVIQKLLDQKAEKIGVKVTAKEIDSNIKQIKSNQNQSDKQGFAKLLKQMGVNETQLRGIVKDELIYTKMEAKAAGNVTVSDAEVKQYYEKNQQMFQQAAGMEIYHILVSSKATAEEVLNKIKAGADWNQLASQYSIDTTTKNSGGDVGVVNQNTNFVTEFKTAALKLKPGEITSQPVKTQYGYHIIKAGEQKPATVIPLSQVQENIRTELVKEKKNSIFSKYLQNLKSKATIKDMR